MVVARKIMRIYSKEVITHFTLEFSPLTFPFPVNPVKCSHCEYTTVIFNASVQKGWISPNFTMTVIWTRTYPNWIMKIKGKIIVNQIYRKLSLLSWPNIYRHELKKYWTSYPLNKITDITHVEFVILQSYCVFLLMSAKQLQHYTHRVLSTKHYLNRHNAHYLLTVVDRCILFHLLRNH